MRTDRLNHPINMKIKFQCLLIMLAGLAGSHRAAAQGTAFAYQGQLQNNGNPASGLYDFEFSLSDASSGGNQIGGTVTNLSVGVTNGLFTTTLDFGSVFNGNPVWLAIGVCSNGVGSFAGLTPLQPIRPVVSAIFANTASNLSGTIPATQVSGAVGNGQLANNSITVTAGTGLAGGGAVGIGRRHNLEQHRGTFGDRQLGRHRGHAKRHGDAGGAHGQFPANLANAMVKRDAGGNFSKPGPSRRPWSAAP